jgi:predicted Holliday junction resolvase-like endonuclease
MLMFCLDKMTAIQHNPFMQPMATIPQQEDAGEKVFQVKLSEEVRRRIKVRAAATEKSPGDVISALVLEHLPPVAEPNSKS